MIFFLSILVILLSLLILYNNFSKNKNSFYLCGSLICMSIGATLHHFTIIAPNRFFIAILVGHTIPVAFLTGPLLFFYIRNTLRVSIRFNKLDYLHFLPFIVSLISIFPYYFADFDTKLTIAQILIDKPNYILKMNLSWLYPSSINILIRPFLLFGYSITCFILLYRHNKKKNQIQLDKKQEDISFKWLIAINSIIVLMSLGYTYLTFYFYNLNNTEKSLDLINGSILAYILAMLFCLIPMVILFFPEVVYGVHKIKINKKNKVVENNESHESLEVTAALILDFVKKEENLQNPNFSIADISEALKLKREDIHYCFNVILKTKFTTLRKKLRVDLAKKELNNGKLQFHSMEGIWMKSGFTSKTSFFVTFKEVTGMTPLEYLKSLEKQPTKNL
jgi:AraC-like DNA-binding protein